MIELMVTKIKQYFNLGIIGIIIVLLVYVGYLKYTIVDKDNNILTYQSIIQSKQNTINNIQEALKLAEKQSQENLEKSKQIITKTQKVYVPQIEYVTTFKKDENATECQNANSMLTNFVY